MAAIELPADIVAVFDHFRTCEFTTLARDGTPITWPTLPFWRPEHGHFVVTTSIGLPQKAFNVRRDGRVSLLFSDPTASGLVDPPAVLVQGDATAPDRVETAIAGFEPQLLALFHRQPGGMIYSSHPLLRYLFDWYYMRLYIYVTPRRILAWPRGDMSQPPREVALRHVG
jgi:hypothetical protein